MATVNAPSPQRINSRRISGLGLVIDKPRTPRSSSPPRLKSRTTSLQNLHEAAPPLIPLISVSCAGDHSTGYREASPRYEEVDSAPWAGPSSSRRERKARSETLIDPHLTPKARPSATLPPVASSSATSTAWLFGDDEAHSPYVLSEKPAELSFYPSRRASSLVPSTSAKMRHGFATPLNLGSKDDEHDRTGLPTYAAAMTPPILVAPRWLDNPHPPPRTTFRRDRSPTSVSTIGCETFADYLFEKASDLKATISGIPGKRPWMLAMVWVATLTMAIVVLRYEFRPRPRHPGEDLHAFDVSDLLVNSHPTATLQENLRPGVRYLVGGRGSSPTPSLTEYFTSSYKLVYLGKLLHRVTIIPGLPESANHVPLTFSEIFDADAFHASTSHSIPFVEMAAAKLPAPAVGQPVDISAHHGTPETIACWSSHHLLTGEVLPAVDPSAHPPEALSSYFLSLQPWLLPEKSIARAAGGYDILFESIVAFDWERERKSTWINRLLGEAKSSNAGMSKDTLSILASLRKNNKPTEQLFCLDDTLHLGHALFEPPVPHRQHTYHGANQRSVGDDLAWQTVGKHLQFQRHLVTKADNALRELLNVGQSITTGQARYPRFIAVRAKNGISIQRYASAVQRLGSVLGMKKLSGRSLSRIPTVVFFDGEMSSSTREDIRSRGWILASGAVKDDYSGGSEVMADVLEQIMMTRGVGFVGTGRDATSGVTALRCKSWHGIPTTIA